jgi:hypothetical protein
MASDKDTNEITESITDSEREDLRAAYQSIPQMIAQEGAKQWSATSVFIQFSIAMVAAAIIPSFIPDLSTTVSAIVGVVLSIIGLFASLAWLSFMLRYEKIVLYWVLSAREVEQKMSKHVVAFQRGKDFAAGSEVVVSGERIGYRKLERLPIRSGLYASYIVFFVVYISLLALNIIRLFSA